MTEPPLIEARGVSKAFQRSSHQSQTSLARQLIKLFAGKDPTTTISETDSFWALKDINFDVSRGEAVGVIGHNGAGKTTLLRILNGEQEPDTGTLSVRGRRSSLIDLTSGFATGMTGRDNIYFRGAHLGYSRQFLRDREGDIIDFAGIGEFIDSEIKNYSSGMQLRLGFSISVFVEPDVLLVDEILSVGDFLFSAKCMRKMNELKARAAMIYVSHSLEQIVQFSDRVIVLDRGNTVFYGAPIEAVAYYRALEEHKDALGEGRITRLSPKLSGSLAISRTDTGGSETIVEENPSFSPPEPKRKVNEQGHATPPIEAISRASITDAPTAQLDVHSLLATQLGDFIDNPEAITAVLITWTAPDGTPREHGFTSGEAVGLSIRFTPLRTIRRLVVGVPLWDETGNLVTAFGTQGHEINQSLSSGREHHIQLDVVSLPLNRGEYTPVVAILDGTEYIYRKLAPPLRIERNSNPLAWGLVTLPYFWRQENYTL